MAEAKDLPIQDRLDQIRGHGGSVKLDGENLTADSDTSNGAGRLMKYYDPKDNSFLEKIREVLEQADFEAKWRRQVNKDNLQSRKMAAHPDVSVDSNARWASLDWHHCKNKKCCAN